MFVAAIRLWSATELLNYRLTQIAIGYMAVYYVAAAVVFFINYRRADNPLMRQQLKWLNRGTLLAVTPFTLLYAIPYLLAGPSSATMLGQIGVLCLVFFR